jgi:hypothetical protein
MMCDKTIIVLKEKYSQGRGTIVRFWVLTIVSRLQFSEVK